MSYTHKLYLGYIELRYMNHASFYNLGKFNSPHLSFLPVLHTQIHKGKQSTVINLFKSMYFSW